MNLAGIDVTKFKSRSVRSASASKAKLCHVPLKEIMNVAGWLNAKTFVDYYEKPLEECTSSYVNAVLL